MQIVASLVAALVHHGGGRVHASAVVRRCVDVVHSFTNDLVTIGTDSVQATRVHLLGI